jgi:hypothetical protein
MTNHAEDGSRNDTVSEDNADGSTDGDGDGADDGDGSLDGEGSNGEDVLYDDKGNRVTVSYDDAQYETEEVRTVGHTTGPPAEPPDNQTRYRLRDRRSMRSPEEIRLAREIDEQLRGETTMLTQLSMKAGLRAFGDRGADAVKREMKQLHDMGALRPVENLTHDEKTSALKYLMYLKEKSDGVIKGRGCADGRKQRETTSKHDATSTTVSLESVFMTSLIEAKEKRDVAVADIP